MTQTGAINASTRCRYGRRAGEEDRRCLAGLYPGPRSPTSRNSNPFKPRIGLSTQGRWRCRSASTDEPIDVVFRGTRQRPRACRATSPPWQSTDYQPLQRLRDRYRRSTRRATRRCGRHPGGSGTTASTPSRAQDGVPDHGSESLDFNGDRAFTIVQRASPRPVKVTEQSGGDSTSAYAIETGDNCDATKADRLRQVRHRAVDWIPYVDPDPAIGRDPESGAPGATPVGTTCSTSCTSSRHGGQRGRPEGSGTTDGQDHPRQLVVHPARNEQGRGPLGRGRVRPQLAGYNYSYMSAPTRSRGEGARAEEQGGRSRLSSSERCSRW
jgi:hypothetical protein